MFQAVASSAVGLGARPDPSTVRIEVVVDAAFTDLPPVLVTDC